MHKKVFGVVGDSMLRKLKAGFNCDCYYHWILMFVYINSCK